MTRQQGVRLGLLPLRSAFGYDVGGRKQDRQLIAFRCIAGRRDGDRQSEEAGVAHRFVATLRFQRPAHGFGADIDAEHGLGFRRRSLDLCRQPGRCAFELGGDRAEEAGLCRLLEDQAQFGQRHRGDPVEAVPRGGRPDGGRFHIKAEMGEQRPADMGVLAGRFRERPGTAADAAFNERNESHQFDHRGRGGCTRCGAAMLATPAQVRGPTRQGGDEAAQPT